MNVCPSKIERENKLNSKLPVPNVNARLKLVTPTPCMYSLKYCKFKSTMAADDKGLPGI